MRRLGLLALAILMASAMWRLSGDRPGGVEPITSTLAPSEGAVSTPEVLSTKSPGGGGSSDQVGRRSALNSERSKIDLAAPKKDSDRSESKRWLLSIQVAADWSPLPNELELVRMGERTIHAKYDPVAQRYHADLMGRRDELEQGEWLMASGSGRTAQVAVVVLASEPGRTDAVGTLSMDQALWDERRLRVEVQGALLERVPRLGALAVTPAAAGTTWFRVTCDGAEDELGQTITFDLTRSRAELGTFLPATTWTARVMGGEPMRSDPDWKESAARGEDITVELTDARGIRVFGRHRFAREAPALLVIPVPASRDRSLTKEEFLRRSKRSEMKQDWQFMLTHVPKPEMAHRYRGLGQVTVGPGSYMVELWSGANAEGLHRLLDSKPALVREGFVDIFFE